MLSTPRVTVVTGTYNHERYIRQCMESVLMQETSFPVELLVGEDASTDATLSIVEQIASQYPDRVHVTAHASNVGAMTNGLGLLQQSRGEYIALLEGDDYWTDSHKLQKQVDALDAHPDWAICFHTTRCVPEDGSPAFDYPKNRPKDVSTFAEMLQTNFMATSSVVYRNRLFPAIPEWMRDLEIGDWPLHLLNSHHGDIGFLNETMSVYRIHSRGAWSAGSHARKLRATLRMWSAVDEHFQRKYSRQIDEHRMALVDEYVQSLEQSYSYRIGRAITTPVARVLNWFRLRTNGRN